MLNYVSLHQLFPLDWHQLDWTRLDWAHLLPAPDRLYSSAGSLFVAAAIGGAYGLVGRVVYPHAGISPLNYAIWFVAAYQIKQLFNLIETRLDNFMGVGIYLDQLEHTRENELDLEDQVRFHSWKLIRLKHRFLEFIDQIASRILSIRPYTLITAENVQGASFIEMCRYRTWDVFKTTVVDTISSSVAYRLTNAMGFILPARTAVPLFIIMRSIIKDILLVPALYQYARLCDHLADRTERSARLASIYRMAWIRRFLPPL